MTLKELSENINKILIDNPESASFKVVTSIDDEGNGFNPVNFQPQVGFYDENEKDFDENKGVCDGIVQAVCIN